MRWLLVFLLGTLTGVAGVYLLNYYLPAPLVAAITPAAAPVAEPVVAPPPAATVATPPPPVEPVPSVSIATPPEPVVVSPAAAPPAEGLLIPIAGIRKEQLSDSFDQARDGHRHEAIDIMSPRGTPVLAVADGKVVKLFHSKPGGLTVYQFDPAEKLAYYYAHLDRYAPALAEGKVLKRGDLIGYVGSTGNADPAAPHLHFAVFELGPEKQWWKGKALNPYTLLVDQ